MSDWTVADAVGVSIAAARAWDAEAPPPEAGSLGACEQTALALLIVQVFDAITAEWRETITDTLAELPDGALWLRSLQRAIAAGEEILDMRDAVEQDQSGSTDHDHPMTEDPMLEQMFAAPAIEREAPPRDSAALPDAARAIASSRAASGIRRPRPGLALPTTGRLV